MYKKSSRYFKICAQFKKLINCQDRFLSNVILFEYFAEVHCTHKKIYVNMYKQNQQHRLNHNPNL